MHSRAVRLAGAALLLACACASLGLLAGCGSGDPQLPEVTTGVMVGPQPHKATITVSSSGEGYGVVEVVLTYPDGSRHAAGVGVLERDLSLGWTTAELPSGQYTYTLYAVPTATQPIDADFPSDGRAEKNIISSGSFTID